MNGPDGTGHPGAWGVSRKPDVTGVPSHRHRFLPGRSSHGFARPNRRDCAGPLAVAEVDGILADTSWRLRQLAQALRDRRTLPARKQSGSSGRVSTAGG